MYAAFGTERHSGHGTGTRAREGVSTATEPENRAIIEIDHEAAPCVRSNRWRNSARIPIAVARIAAFNHGGGWLVYLDHVMQHNKLFVSAEAAMAWLRQRIDVAPATGR